MNASKQKARADELIFQARQMRNIARNLTTQVVHAGLAAKALEEQAEEIEKELTR